MEFRRFQRHLCTEPHQSVIYGDRVGFASSVHIWNDKRDLCVGSEAEYESGRDDF